MRKCIELNETTIKYIKICDTELKEYWKRNFSIKCTIEIKKLLIIYNLK